MAQILSKFVAPGLDALKIADGSVGNTEFERLDGNELVFTAGKESNTLDAGEITAQFVDLAQTIKANSLEMIVGGVQQLEGTDYTVNLTGGAGGVTRVTFAGPLATAGAYPLVAGDVLHFAYNY